jgi:hypothetical protein
MAASESGVEGTSRSVARYRGYGPWERSSIGADGSGHLASLSVDVVDADEFEHEALAAVESGQFTPSAQTERYVEAFVDFVLYTSSDGVFADQYTHGSGRPIVALESAAAHLAKAEEWVAAGSP